MVLNVSSGLLQVFSPAPYFGLVNLDKEIGADRPTASGEHAHDNS